jgi:hypothetical protein
MRQQRRGATVGCTAAALQDVVLLLNPEKNNTGQLQSRCAADTHAGMLGALP